MKKNNCKVSIGDYIDAKALAGSTEQGHYAANLTNMYGMNGATSKSDTHSNNKFGENMWLSGCNLSNEVWVIFDLQKVYPIGEMWIWNYNQFDTSCPEVPYINRGLKNISLYYSLDNTNWTELKGKGYPYQLAKADGSPVCGATNLNDGKNSPIDFFGISARYVKLTANTIAGQGNWGGIDGMERKFGLSKVRFYVGRGLMVEPAEEWTDLFHRQSGWTGSDGIFSIPYSGCETRGSSFSTKTIFLFGDTFIGEVESDTDKRLEPWSFVNNSLAILEGGKPDSSKIKFVWGEKGTYNVDSVFIPDTPSCSRSSGQKYWYWVQDGVLVNGRLVMFPMLIRDEPNGLEGFQFAVHGVTTVSVPLGQNGPDFKNQRQSDTNLFYSFSDGQGFICYGCGIMANTIEAGAIDPDGYIYVYGYIKEMSIKDDITSGDNGLVVARIKAEDIDNVNEFRFWNGSQWVQDIKESSPLTYGVSPELSVTPMQGGLFHGKYLLVYEKNVNSNIIACRIGESPVGPFGDIIPLYYAPEPEKGKSIYTYNAKAHPHLSAPGELLISYNVNASNMDMHIFNAEIYRPRFIRLCEII